MRKRWCLVRFEVLATDGAARRGKLITAHGAAQTPAFMTVGTQGTVKGLLPRELAEAGAEILLGNTYHLMLRPGEKTVAALGDLHGFMAWPGPILTDSGGYQVFSLAELNHITDEGVRFKSHIDGAVHFLTPQRSMQVQNDLGADIIMAFDQCPPSLAPREVQLKAVERTERWAEICLRSHARPAEQALFAIVQGGVDLELRSVCAQSLIGMNFPGYAIGGLAVGEGHEAMKRVLYHTAPLLPSDKPRYLMGVGFPRDIAAAVDAGVDMFDCVMPTRNGRNAYAFTAEGPLRLRNSQFATDKRPIEAGCDCYACRTFTRGAIRHYFFAGEMLGPMLLSVHNVRFYQRFMTDLRRAIADGQWRAFYQTDPRCRLGPRTDGSADETPPDAVDQPPTP